MYIIVDRIVIFIAYFESYPQLIWLYPIEQAKVSDVEEWIVVGLH